jgi:hypothetical protein
MFESCLRSDLPLRASASKYRYLSSEVDGSLRALRETCAKGSDILANLWLKFGVCDDSVELQQ